MNIKKEQVVDKRTAILKTTLDLISERGFHNTPMSLIAQTAGVSIGIVYHYFSGKEELINELYKEIKLEIFQAMLADYSEDLSLNERFLGIWFNYIHYSLDHPTNGLFLEQFENSPYLKHLEGDFTQAVAPFFSLFEQGVESEVFIPLSPIVLFDLSYAPVPAMVKRHFAGFIKLDDELIKAAAAACWNAIKA
jgi:AcrR family transcriptional regulator